MTNLFISVIIPTYKRSKELKKCINALERQKMPAQEIIVVARDNDDETKTVLESMRKDLHIIKKALVREKGQVAALNEGLKEAQGEIIAFTDDDSIPHTDWLFNINKDFCSGSNIGVVGGKDFVYSNGCLVREEEKEVGLIKWYGRIIGKHHAGFGHSRPDDGTGGYQAEVIVAAELFQESAHGRAFHVETAVGFPGL